MENRIVKEKRRSQLNALYLSKIHRIMKLTFLLIILGILQVKATGWGQDISLSVENEPLEKVFQQIRSQSGYDFIYTTELINQSRPVTMHVSGLPVSEVLNLCFINQPFTYLVDRKTIILRKKIRVKIVDRLMQKTYIPLPAILPADTLRGFVRDANGEPLIGVNVQVKGTNRGTATDFDGRFVLLNVEEDATLIFSYIGYEQEEMAINGRSIIDLTMVSDVEMLDEVVVVGYGTQKKSDLTGSISSVPRDRLDDSPNINISQAIQGAVSGVLIQTNSAGAAPSEGLMIRGRNSINADNTPLIVVDGISYEGNISDINPSDVESIEVLKDASASAIYGARGANGVILITTKKGIIGEPKLSYNVHVSFQSYSKVPNVMNGEEFIKFREERFPGVVTQSEIKVLEEGNSVDWNELGLRNGLNHEHNLSVSGAVGRTSYYLSGGYLGVQGIVINDDFKRFTGRLNVDVPIKDWLTIGTRTQLSSDDKSGVPPSQSGLFYMNPNSTPYDEDGNLTIYPWPEDTYFGNPLGPILYDDKNTSDQVLSNNFILVDFPFIKGLNYRFNAGFRKKLLINLLTGEEKRLLDLNQEEVQT